MPWEHEHETRGQMKCCLETHGARKTTVPPYISMANGHELQLNLNRAVLRMLKIKQFHDKGHLIGPMFDKFYLYTSNKMLHNVDVKKPCSFSSVSYYLIS